MEKIHNYVHFVTIRKKTKIRVILNLFAAENLNEHTTYKVNC